MKSSRMPFRGRMIIETLIAQDISLSKGVIRRARPPNKFLTQLHLRTKNVTSPSPKSVLRLCTLRQPLEFWRPRGKKSP